MPESSSAVVVSSFGRTIPSARRYSRKASDRGIRRAFGVTERSLEMLERRRWGWSAYLGCQEWNEQFRICDLVIGSKGSWRKGCTSSSEDISQRQD
jgi:hypothetical protein